MAKKKISQLPAGSALTGLEIVPIVQTGTTKQITAQDIANLGNASGVEGSGTINQITKFTASSTIGDSKIYDDGTNVGIETTTAINRFIMSANASIAKIFSFRSGNLPRWAFRVDGTESGANAGADLAIRRYNDAGTFIDAPLSFARATGAATFASSVTATGNVSSYGQLRLETSAYGSIVVGSRSSQTDFQIYNTGNIFRIYNGTSDALNINTSGNVGIGTTTPTEKLHVSGGNIIVNSSSAIGWGDRSAQLVGVTGASGYLRFDTNDTERMRITSGGNVLIGTTTDAGYKLDVNGTARLSGELLISTPDDSGMRIKAGATRLSYIDFADANTGTPSGSIAYNHSSDFLTFNTGGSNTERMRITSAGNVGIGTTAPDSKLKVVNSITDYSPTLILQNTATSDGALVGLRMLPNNGASGLYIGIHSSGFENQNVFINQEKNADLLVLTNSTERMRIKAGGNVLIGTTTDAGYKLNVNGTGRVFGTSAGLTIQSTSAGQNAELFFTSTATTWRVGQNIGTVTDFEIYNGGTLFKMATSGAATFSGQVNIGNPVAAAVAVASTHKVTVVIGGTTYYLLATT